MKKLISENKGIFSGRITRISKLQNVTIVEVMVHNEDRRRDPNFINFMFYRNNRKEVENFEKGEIVNVEGHMSSYLKQNAEGKNIRAQCIIADKIEKAETSLEKAFGTKGNNFVKEKNEFYIAGIISRIWKNGNMVNIVINTQNGLHLEPIKTTLFTKEPDKILEEYKEGSSICTICRMQTERKVTEEKTTFYENLIIRDYSNMEGIV